MKIGIHHTKGSFSERWIAYCESNHISWKPVNCYRNDIIEQLTDCDSLMWHFSHMNAKDIKFARQLHYALQVSGKVVFPDFFTMWHFDDKVGQKYLLESIGAPVVPTFVFYDKQEALRWTGNTVFPKVFKLKSGAGSENVRLVSTRKEAEKLVIKAFGHGFSQNNALSDLKERWRKYRLGKSNFFDIIKGLIRFIYPNKYVRMAGKEKGYVYFQDFISGNSYDVRIIVIDDKAFAIKRMVRKNDFRASGSGHILYEKEHFQDETIALAISLAEKLKGQSIAFDFIFDNGVPKVCEISYGFVKEGYDPCGGYWDKDLTWHPGPFNPYGWMVDTVVREIKSKKRPKVFDLVELGDFINKKE